MTTLCTADTSVTTSGVVHYVQFLLGSPLQFTCTEAARVQPDEPDPPAHDAFTRLLTRLEPDPEALWQEAQPLVRRDDGILVLDDSTLDKPYARKMGLVAWHWSGKHHAVVNGINLFTLVWTDGDRHIPCDYRLYDKANDGLEQERPLRASSWRARSSAASPRVRLLRRLVQRPGEPEADPLAWAGRG